MTLNEKINQLFDVVISYELQEKLAELKAEYDENLKKDSRYIELKKALDNYEIEFKRKGALAEVSNRIIRQLATAASLSVKGCKIPKNFAISTDSAGDNILDKKIIKSQKLLDTQARLVSFICDIDNSFCEAKARKKKEAEYEAFSMSEKRMLVSLFNSNALSCTHEELRAQILRGKKKK